MLNCHGNNAINLTDPKMNAQYTHALLRRKCLAHICAEKALHMPQIHITPLSLEQQHPPAAEYK